MTTCAQRILEFYVLEKQDLDTKTLLSTASFLNLCVKVAILQRVTVQAVNRFMEANLKTKTLS